MTEKVPINEKLPKSDQSFEVPHEGEGFINEALWKKVIFKVMANFVYILSISIVIGTSLYFSVDKFITGIQVIILPLVWAALDAQSRNKEIQASIKAEAEKATEREHANTELARVDTEIQSARQKLMEKQQEVYRLRAILMAKTDNVAAMDDAINRAEELLRGE